MRSTFPKTNDGNNFSDSFLTCFYFFTSQSLTEEFSQGARGMAPPVIKNLAAPDIHEMQKRELDRIGRPITRSPRSSGMYTYRLDDPPALDPTLEKKNWGHGFAHLPLISSPRICF